MQVVNAPTAHERAGETAITIIPTSSLLASVNAARFCGDSTPDFAAISVFSLYLVCTSTMRAAIIAARARFETDMVLVPEEICGGVA